MSPVLPPQLLAEVRSVTRRIRAATDPLEKAAAMAAGRDVEARCLPHLRSYAAEEALRKAQAAPVTYTKGWTRS